MCRRRIGFDIGRVVLDRKNGGAAPSFFEGDYLQSPQIPGAFEGLRRLRDDGDEIYLISKVGNEFRHKTNEWFFFHEFHRRTRIPENHVIYCHERSFKTAICQGLEITHFVDDRFAVHRALAPFGIFSYIFNPTREDAALCSCYLPEVPIVYRWDDLIAKHLLSPELARA